VINLLPPERADTIRYGRQNAVLRKWLVGLAAAIAVLLVVLVGGWIYIDRQSKSLQASINVTNQELKSQNLSKVQADAKQITGDIRIINQVLSSEVRFSDLIKAIGQDMPPGTVLGSLSLSKVSGAINLTASAKDFNSVAQIAANLSDPQNGLFSKVDVINTTCTSASTTPYSCTATLKALFSNSAKNKFLSVPKEDHS
jgi:Tfp pilus assembly protein PilN